ncbi:MAG: hypothetical protein LV481_17450 [Methylacidiphilales bacterium]|nr:hypothetical protein [Candidatus Methylacidiphilales bacterium]
MKLMIVSRVFSLLLLWLPASYLYHLLLLHELHRKMSMSPEELHDYYVRIAGTLASPLLASLMALSGLLVTIFFYELLAFVILTGLQRLAKNGQEELS